MTIQLPHDATVLAPAATITAVRPPRRADHRFYAWAAAAAFAIVFAGFARTYYLRFLFGASTLPWLLHLHGALMTSWFALFFVQTYLVASHRVRLHRRLGVFGAVLAGLMVIVGATVALRFGARVRHKAHLVGGPPPLMAMGFFLAVLLVFAILVSAALLLRRRSDYHKRLMLMCCLSLVGPGLTRIPFNQVPALAFLKSGGLFGLFSLDILLVYACIAWDTWRHRRLHPAFVGGALLMIAAEDSPLIWLFLSTPMWTHFATWLVSQIA